MKKRFIVGLGLLIGAIFLSIFSPRIGLFPLLLTTWALSFTGGILMSDFLFRRNGRE